MQPGGVSDIIERFVGLLDIDEEAGRDRTIYDEFASERVRVELDAPPAPVEEAPKPDLEETFSRKQVLRYAPEEAPPTLPLPPDDIDAAALRAPVLPSRITRSPDPHFDKDHGGGGGGQSKNIIYKDAGDDRLVQADQLNWMRDNDRFTDNAQLHLDDLDLSRLFAGSGEDLVTALDAASKTLPADLVGGDASTTELMEWAAARTPGAPPDRESNEAAQELLPGRYVDGEKVTVEAEDATASADTGSDDTGAADGQAGPASTRPEVGEPPAYVYGEVDIGQVARTGDNTADNVARIVDVNGTAGTMIVMGDWFETNAIIQTNIYSDRDHVMRSGGGGGIDGTVETGGNVTNNTAELVAGNPWADVELPAFKGKFIRCDVVDGDFYDIKAFTQTNWLQDHDVVVQQTCTSFAMIDAGLNEQYNGLFLREAFDYYDVIIVGGDYHSANLIYQTNIVLDDDWVVVTSGAGGEGGDGASIYTGQNWLFNNALIKDYGIDDAEALPFHLELLASQIAAGGDVVDVQAAWGLAGNGSQTLNVLYIKGDYFDLNLVHQVNVVLDADVVVQQVPNGGHLGVPQYASTGHNAATNDATIVTASAIDALFVGGEHYEDSILIQAEIVVGEDDNVCEEGCSDLPPEIVAFTTDSDDQGSCDEPLTSPVATYNDVLSNIVT